MNASYWLNTFWMATCRSEARCFQAATQSVQDTQAHLLRRILTQNESSRFGREHCFLKIRGHQQYRQQVPLSTYEDYRDAVAQIAAGTTHVLTRERVRLLEPTGGSTSGEKLIPYTAELRRQFQRSIDAWIHDLLTHRPKVRSGRAYWSISPCLGPPRITAGGIPIGFDDDVAYLSRWEQLAVRRILAVPPTVAKLPNMNHFRYATLLHLLAASDLALISVWSPTFLTALFDDLESWIEPLCYDLRHGTISWPSTAAPTMRAGGERRSVPPADGMRAVRRAELLESVWATSSCLAEFFAQVWPGLQLISCWRDGAAAQYANHLEKLFPNVEIQPKGLLATEAFVSLPLCDRHGSALAIRSHYFEFVECAAVDHTASSARSSAATCLADELEVGKHYQVVVTTGGGLYRYQLGDRIEVVGFENRCPLIRFLGRTDKISDLVGEKLNDAHVHDVLQRAFRICPMEPVFAILVPRSKPAGYQLLLQSSSAPRAESVELLRARVESGLAENPYYRHAVAAGQLAPLFVTVLDPSASSYWRRYEDFCLGHGQKAGDIKPTVLAPVDWLANTESPHS